MKLVEKSSSSSRAEDKVSTIGAEPVNFIDSAAALATRPATRATRLAQRGIIIRELVPHEESTQEKVLERKGKKNVKNALTVPT